MNKEEEIEKELLRLSSIGTRDKGFRNFKSEDNYRLEARHYPILERKDSDPDKPGCDGIRRVWVPKSREYNKDVQTTRTLNVESKDFEKLKSQFEAQSSTLGGNDISRIWELENWIESNSSLGKIKQIAKDAFKQGRLSKDNPALYPLLHGPSIDPIKFAEIGFRNLKLMKTYEAKYDIPVKGYDICTLSVNLGQIAGYDCNYTDLNTLTIDDNIDLSDCNLVSCYHVLEHVEDPLMALQHIYSAMSDDFVTIFHIEVPLEHQPNRVYGHLFPFHEDDLQQFCMAAGFGIGASTIHTSHTLDGDYRYNRIIALKRGHELSEFLEIALKSGVAKRG